MKTPDPFEHDDAPYVLVTLLAETRTLLADITAADLAELGPEPDTALPGARPRRIRTTACPLSVRVAAAVIAERSLSAREVP
jgi:hypothetical protein